MFKNFWKFKTNKQTKNRAKRIAVKLQRIKGQGLGKFIDGKLDKRALKLYKPSFQNMEYRGVCVSMPVHVCTYVCRYICTDSPMLNGTESSSMVAGEIGCEKDLGTGCILINFTYDTEF